MGWLLTDLVKVKQMKGKIHFITEIDIGDLQINVISLRVVVATTSTGHSLHQHALSPPLKNRHRSPPSSMCASPLPSSSLS
ncbi:hypothetical protein L2E82_37267 [Cichorium intybus]|uniref:Uncharacterized protein n=1 Tax=Cichorium intybus TaxID=13427 RepID=A0ACB9AE67_CICIN|nr:hypothetical protein L2E82_37267 [Cichorium intybus]